MASKPNKCGLKLCLAVDAENKYLFNGLLYVEKDNTRSPDVSVPSDAALKLMLATTLRATIFSFSLDLVL